MINFLLHHSSSFSSANAFYKEHIGCFVSQNLKGCVVELFLEDTVAQHNVAVELVCLHASKTLKSFGVSVSCVVDPVAIFVSTYFSRNDGVVAHK